METLEQTIAEVERLNGYEGLHAEIVEQEEVRHEEPEGLRGEDLYWRSGEPVYRTVIDKPRIAYPDTRKREEAKQRLQEIYNDNEWYSSRYMAGRALNVKPRELDEKLDLWLKDLERDLSAGEEKETGIVDHIEYGKEIYSKGGYYAGGSPEEIPIYVKEFVPDKPIRIRAIRDLVKLAEDSKHQSVTNLIRKTYKTNRVDEVEEEAGKSLNYSNSRIWIHKNRDGIGCIGCLFATVGAASGIGYMLYQYLSR